MEYPKKVSCKVQRPQPGPRVHLLGAYQPIMYIPNDYYPLRKLRVMDGITSDWVKENTRKGCDTCNGSGKYLEDEINYVCDCVF